MDMRVQERREKKNRSGIRIREKESRGLRDEKIGYYKRAGRGRNILQEAGKPHRIEVASIKQNSTCW